MKICIQSGTPLGTSDIYKPYYDSLLRHAKRVAGPGTEVEFPNLGKNYPGAARSITHLHFVAHETIKSGMRAQKDRKSTRLNSSHIPLSRMPSSA